MTRIATIICVLLCISCGCKQSHIAYTSVHVSSNSWLEHTVWKITYTHKEWGKRTFEVYLGEQGKLACFNPFDTTPYNDEWELRNDKIILYFNNRDAVYEALVFDDEVLVGTAHSYVGGTWDWFAKRYKQ
ncbi:MAG TPA: hypothetical protein PK199_02450 [Bacteroidales bacterium]|nr:hypothetical protein [Bacteroidales bacterium]